MRVEIPAVEISFPGSVPYDWLVGGYDYGDILSPIWTEQEAGALAPPPDLTVSEWADANRVLQAGISRRPGPWRTDYTPYLREVMDAYCIPSVRHLVFVAGTQLGKTESVYNIVGYIIDHDPYPTLMMSPREDDAKMISRTRLQPMINDCESLQKKKSPKRSEFKTLEMHFPGMILYLAGANSLAGLASKPCRNVIRDEKNKYVKNIGDDAGPDEKSEERTKDYWDIRKIIDVSSPGREDEGILLDLKRCNVINVVHHPCPHCKQLIRLYPEQLQYEDIEDDPYRAIRAKQSAVYVCQLCGAEITDQNRPWMIANYRFVAQQNITFGLDDADKNTPLGELDFEPEEVGFWVSSMSSPILSWGHMAEQKVKAVMHRDETGSSVKLQNIVNDWWAEPWLESVQKSTVELILAKKGLRDPLVVPSWAVALTCGIDPQKFGFWVTVWAFSASMQSAKIYHSFLVTWDDVWKLVFDTWFAVEESNLKMKIWRAAIDIGGGKDSQFGEDFTKTEEIVTWVRENGMGVIFATKGMSVNNTGQKIRHSIMDKMPGEKGGKIPGGLSLWLIDTEQMKDTVFWRFENKEADPQPLELDNQTEEDFAKQIVAEEKQRGKNGRWSYVRVSKDNHYLDTTCLAHAAADFQWLGGVKILSHPQYADVPVVGQQRNEEREMGHGRDTVRNVQRPPWLRDRR